MMGNQNQIEQANKLLQATVDQGKIDVPVLPETAHQVMILIQDPESDAAQLAKIIQADPTMGGHVMRIANSAAYTPNSNLVSIQQAIARLGMIEISNIAFSTSVNSKMFHAPGYEKNIAQIWQHALASALWSKEISRAMRSNVEAAFLCGLLHTIGQPVILQTISELPSGNEKTTDDDLKTLFAHFEISFSKSVCNDWGLPNIVTEAITYYKNYKEAPNESELSAIVAFGHQLADLKLQPEDKDLDEIRDSDTLDVLNLYPDQVAQLLEKQEAIQSSVESMSH